MALNSPLLYDIILDCKEENAKYHMKNFLEWLESVGLEEPRTHIDSGGGWDDIDDGDDGDDDEDFDNGPWGWKKMESLNLALHQWAKTSPDMAKIAEIVTSALFSKGPEKEEIRVFPGHVQVEMEWFLDISKWGNLDDQIESALKRSDLYSVLGIRQNELWNVMDQGAVYDYMMYVIIMNLTGRADRERSPIDNQAAFHAYQYIREDWPTLEKTIKWEIESAWEQNYPQMTNWIRNNLNIRLDTSGRSFNQPMGVSQAINNADTIWAKGVVQVNYQTAQPNWEEEEDTAWRWGEERPIGQRQK